VWISLGRSATQLPDRAWEAERAPLTRHRLHDLEGVPILDITVRNEMPHDVDGLESSDPLKPGEVQRVSVVAHPPRPLPRGDLAHEVAGLGLAEVLERFG